MMKNVLALLLAVALLGPSGALRQASGAASDRAPASRNDGWSTAQPSSAGLDARRLAAMTAAIRADPELNVHAILIERNGKLVYEEYFDGVDERWGQPPEKVSMTMESKHDLRSVTKSVVSALVGIARGEGAISSLDQPLISWFPEYPELDTAELRRVTLLDALTMSAGFEWDERIAYTDPRNGEIRMGRDPRPLRFVLSQPLVTEPGRTFNYNGGLPQAMASVIQRATKTPFLLYARERLFGPLGITDVDWRGALGDLPSAASGLRLRPRDLAKFASLYLHGGQWNGKQVVPADWIDLSTRRHVRLASPPGVDGKIGYGYFWWYSCQQTPVGLTEARFAMGNGEQRVIVYPGLKMAVTILAGRYNERGGPSVARNIVREHILPALQTDIRTGCPGLGS